MTQTADIRRNLTRVLAEIAEACARARRDPASVRLIAVTKTFPAETIQAAYDCGLRDFGENRVQEFQDKLPNLSVPGAAFHFIGHLQSNKVRPAMAFDWIQTVDSERLARRLSQSARDAGKTLPLLIEVKLSAEEAKAGVLEDALANLTAVVSSLPSLELRGLMTLPPFTEDPEGARPYFRRLRELRDNLENSGHSLRELSMGMTHDFQVAVEEGATMVRLGTAIFGAREKQ
jgi:pyridoxal phosphate enzyme (YggS family)